MYHSTRSECLVLIKSTIVQVDDRALGASHELELAVEGREALVDLELGKDRGCFHALTSSTAQKAFAAVGTAFVTAPGWICETAGHIRLYCGRARHTLFAP